MSNISDDDLDSLMDQYASAEAIRSAKKQKEEVGAKREMGELVKDYPKPQRDLDLHGFTVPEAIYEMEQFIQKAIQHQLRTVRVITGKGLHSKNMISVLPGEIEQKLSQLKRKDKILGFRREKTGGSFAIYLIS